MGQILKDSVKQNIIDGAIDDIYENGYMGASMRKIASIANMTVGNLYRYFKNKDELINYIIQPALTRINKIIYKHTNQTIDLNNPNFDLSKLTSNEILNTFDELSIELVNLYIEHPKVLAIFMMNSTINDQMVNWFKNAMKQFMRLKHGLNDTNEQRYDVLARMYSVSIFSGVKESLLNSNLNEKELKQVLQMYFRGYIQLVDTHVEMED